MGVGISLFGAVGCDELYAHDPRQFFPPLRRPVIAISDGHSKGGLQELGEHAKLMGVGWSYRDAGNYSRPAEAHMHPEAVEGLLEEGVLTESSLSPEAATAVGAGKQARWQRHRVYESEGRVVRSE